MKIKLQDYGLISIEWIDKEIERLQLEYKSQDDVGQKIIAYTLLAFRVIRQKLIPSEKLADVSFNNGYHKGYNVGQKDFESHPLALTIANHIHQDRQEFLESEIEILCKHQ